MEQSRRFRFEVAYRVGDVEVLWVSRRAGRQLKQGEAVELSTMKSERKYAGLLFRRGLRLLQQGKHERAEAMFVRVSESSGADVTGAFYAAVAKEFSMKLDDAVIHFKKFRAVTQAGTYLFRASHHQNIIESLQAAEKETSASEKAYLYHWVASDYWGLGFRSQERRMLDRS